MNRILRVSSPRETIVKFLLVDASIRRDIGTPYIWGRSEVATGSDITLLCKVSSPESGSLFLKWIYPGTNVGTSFHSIYLICFLHMEIACWTSDCRYRMCESLIRPSKMVSISTPWLWRMLQPMIMEPISVYSLHEDKSNLPSCYCSRWASGTYIGYQISNLKTIWKFYSIWPRGADAKGDNCTCSFGTEVRDLDSEHECRARTDIHLVARGNGISQQHKVRNRNQLERKVVIRINDVAVEDIGNYTLVALTGRREEEAYFQQAIESE